jgi:hemerythrin-like metal-binding protein
MDIQHDYLYGLFYRIEQSSHVTDQAFTKSLLTEVEHYILFHFSCEEQLMRMYGVPTFAVHQSDHEQAGARLSDFIDDFEAGKLNPASLRGFLIGWLSDHSKVSDFEYVQWIKTFRLKLFEGLQS